MWPWRCRLGSSLLPPPGLPLTQRRLRLLGPALLVAALALTAWIYAGSLTGPFLFDDQQNIVGNVYVQPESLSWQSLQAAAKAYAGFPGRPVSTISFALSYRLSGLDPVAFKAANLLIHLLCGFSLFALCRAILRAARDAALSRLGDSEQAFVAALAAALWMLHPLQVSTVLYAVQRMAMLSTLFCLLGMLAYVESRRAQMRGESGLALLLATGLCVALGTLSKENGALLPLLCGVLEAGLFRLRATSTLTRKLLTAFWLGGLGVATLVVLVRFPAISQWIQGGYGNREFNFAERLLTQPRALLLYLKMLLLPNIGDMTLYHDDLPVSKDWSTPSDTLPAALIVLGLILSSLIGLAGRYRLFALGLALFFVGHLLESTVIALEMVFEHRNYLPSAGLFFSVALALATAIQGIPRAALSITLLAVLAALTTQRAQLFENRFALVSFTLAHHPESLRTQLWAADTYRSVALALPSNQRSAWIARALPHYQKAALIDAHDVIALFQILELQAMQDARLDAAVFANLARRLNEGPLRASAFIAAHDFLDDIAAGKNRFPASEALALADHLLANPRCIGRGRAMVLSAMATLQTEAFGDYQSAIARSREAADLQPNDPSIWITYIVILFKAGQLEAAERAALHALAVDDGPFRKTLHGILNTIREQRGASDLLQ